MKLTDIYQCFSDETRLRIVLLLARGPLCVCHFQELLRQPQVRISKHLGYLKTKGLVQATRHQNWMIYALPAPLPPALAANLKGLQASVGQLFAKDQQRLDALRPKLDWVAGCCPAAPGAKRVSKPASTKVRVAKPSKPRRATQSPR